MSNLLLSQKYKDFIKCKAPVEFLEGTTAAGKTTVGIFKFFLKVTQSKDYSFFENMKTSREVDQVGFYFEKRIENVQAKIAKLGSIDEAFENQTLLKEYRALRDANIAVHEKLRTFKPTGSFNRIDPTLEHRQTTTTYENARKRREKNFEAWWNGSSK